MIVGIVENISPNALHTQAHNESANGTPSLEWHLILSNFDQLFANVCPLAFSSRNAGPAAHRTAQIAARLAANACESSEWISVEFDDF